MAGQRLHSRATGTIRTWESAILHVGSLVPPTNDGKEHDCMDNIRRRDDSADRSVDGDRDEEGEQRTEWALERTLLAKERTFAAWLRTGLAAFAVGFGVARLLGDTGPPWLARVIGVGLIMAGIAIVLIGFLNYRRALDCLKRHDVRGLPTWALAALSAVLILIGVAGTVLVLI